MRLENFIKIYEIPKKSAHKIFNEAVRQEKTFVIQISQRTKSIVDVEKFIQFIKEEEIKKCQEKRRQVYTKEEKYTGLHTQIIGSNAIGQLSQLLSQKL